MADHGVLDPAAISRLLPRSHAVAAFLGAGLVDRVAVAVAGLVLGAELVDQDLALAADDAVILVRPAPLVALLAGVARACFRFRDGTALAKLRKVTNTGVSISHRRNQTRPIAAYCIARGKLLVAPHLMLDLAGIT